MTDGKEAADVGVALDLQLYGPQGDAMPKPTPYNLRRFSETPVHGERSTHQGSDRRDALANSAAAGLRAGGDLRTARCGCSFLPTTSMRRIPTIRSALCPSRCWRISLWAASERSRCRHRATRTSAAVVAGGWGVDPDESGLGRIAAGAALCAGQRISRGRRARSCWMTMS